MNQPDTDTHSAIYLRSGTDEQEAAIIRLLEQRGLKLVKTYRERATKVKTRVALQRLMQDAAKGEFRTLVIWGLNHFGRPLGGNIKDFMALDSLGIRVISIRETWLEAATLDRSQLLTILGWVVDQEHTQLVERTKQGIAEAKAQGKPWGRPTLMLPKTQRPAVLEQWDAEGRPDGFEGLAAILGCKSPTTAWKVWKQAEAAKQAPATPTPAVLELD